MPSEFPEQPSSAGSGLQEADQRSLMRLLMSTTAATLLGFALLQYLAGQPWLALAELLVGLLLGWACWRIRTARNLTLWIYLYLLPTFSFIIYIIVVPDASASAFVWVYTIPLLAYLLLGRLRGFVLAAPFLLLATLLYIATRPKFLGPLALIDMANALLCGLLIMVFVHVYETRRAAAYRQLERLAKTDALTGVASRGSFQQAMEQSIRETEVSQQGLVLVLLDIDLFKEVNDRYGHDAGDQALRHICNGLRAGLRATDRIGRLGGEEFGLLLPQTDRQGA